MTREQINAQERARYQRHLQRERDRARCRKQRILIERARAAAIRQLQQWGLA